MHPAIARPIRRYLGDTEIPESVQDVLTAASNALYDMDRDREITARTMAVLSSELEERLERVRASEDQYRTLFDAGPNPTFVIRRSDRAVLSWNVAAEKVLGWPREETLQRPIETLGICGAQCGFAARLMGPGRIEPSDVVHTTLTTRSGLPLEAEVQGLDMLINDTAAVLVMIRDVTAQRTAERLEQGTSARFRAFFNHAGMAIQVLSANGTVLEANPPCTDMLGLTPSELLGMQFSELLASDESPSVTEASRDLLASTSRESITLERRFTHRDGSMLWAQVIIARVESGSETLLVAMLQDITERKRMEEQLVRQAFQDDLTGLANRALFRDRLRHALDRRARANAKVAVLLLDLDGFKRVNDSMGHAAGDELIRAIANRILITVRSGETVARLGGDEFAIVIESVAPDEDPRALAERLLEIISAPVHIGERDMVIQASIGIAFALPEEDGDTVLRNADTAMYSAKSNGKQCVHVYHPSMHTRALVRIEVEHELRQALVNNELELHYQPQIRLHDGVVRGFEALLRWRRPNRGLVAPGEFLSVAEETGLIVPIGTWVLHEACRSAQHWPATNGVQPSLSVNLAPCQLERDSLIQDIRDALDQSGLDPRRLVLEITESQIMRAPDAARAKLQAIRALGVRVAVDDFGTGFSSLSQLQFFPVDELKIDRSFVARIGDGDREAAFVRTIISLAKALNAEVVAEGIESPVQSDFLTSLGCELGQGYLYSRAMHVSAIAPFLQANRHFEESPARAQSLVL